MYLSDVDIRRALDSGELQIQSTDPDNHPFEPEQQIRFASVDLRIGNQFTRYRPDVQSVNVVDDANRMQELFERLPDVEQGGEVVIHPGEILIAPTLERIILSRHLAARILGRSSTARLGISVHCSTDFVNPGQNGTLALQLVNHNRFPVTIRPYMSICQLIVVMLSSPASTGYSDRVGLDSRYPYETESMLSRIHLDSEVQRILKTSGLQSSDPSVRKSLASTIESQRERQTDDLAAFLRRNAKSPDNTEEIKKAIERYDENRGSAKRRLFTLTWASSGLFFATLGWLVNNFYFLSAGKIPLEATHIPGTLCLCTVVVCAIARTWKL